MSKRHLEPGEVVSLILPFSEVCMHMQVAGKRMDVLITLGPAAQLLDENGEPFSFPILLGEAGIYRDSQGPYVNV